MGLPRSKYVREGEEAFVHTLTRCVRRAFLYGEDALTGRDFSHRKQWIVDKLHVLAAVFAIDVCAYCIMGNHYHLVLRILADIVAAWSDLEVATRWLTLFPRYCAGKKSLPVEDQIRFLAACPERIAILRKRLCSLSWFMRVLNESIARAANKEDDVKGRFWESRFKCQVLLDTAAIAACMAYVDLNAIRAGIAPTPEASDFTSIQERILAWQRENSSPVSAQTSQDIHSIENTSMSPLGNSIPAPASAATDVPVPSPSWLCPIQSDSHRRGILNMTEAEYLDLVDRSGRILRAGKRGAIDPELAPILIRIGARPEEWFDTVSRFGSRFRLAAGMLPNLRAFADLIGRRWLTGVTAARDAFAASP